MAADVEVTGLGLESSISVVAGDGWFVFLDFPSFLIKRFISLKRVVVLDARSRWS